MKHFLVCSFILEDFQKYHIDVSLVREHAQCVLPASVVISNISTGSRTILHMNRCEQVCASLTMCVSGTWSSSTEQLRLSPGLRMTAQRPVCLLCHVGHKGYLSLSLSVSSWLISRGMPSMHQQWLGRSKVRLRVHVVWFVRPAEVELSFSLTRKMTW